MNRRLFAVIRTILKTIVVATPMFPCALFAQSPTYSTVQKQSEEAEQFFQRREFLRAEESWSQMLSRIPAISQREKAVAYLRRSICRIHLYQDSLALNDVSSSIELLPNAESYYVRSGIYTRQKQTMPAMSDIEKAIELLPDKGEYYLLRGNIHFQEGQRTHACDDIAMAKILGVAVPDDIAYSTCEEVGIAMGKSVKDSTRALENIPSTVSTVAESSIHSLLVQTNNLNTTYHLFSIQALYGRTGTMLSRLYYDTDPGYSAMLNVSVAFSREFSLWGGVIRSTFAYTYGSERSLILKEAESPFGNVVSTVGLLGGRYSLPMGNNVDAQLDAGIGYKYTTFPSDVPIPLNGGIIRKANLGIRVSSGLALQSSIGVEWRILKQVALTGNIVFGLSFTPYNFLTISRIDRENLHQFLGYVGGIRLYLFEQTP